jgi:phospholipid/cholesterol/gamma-HCH transport system substrate-binding protein
VIRTAVKVQLLAFLLLSALAIAYVGDRYIGLSKTFREPITIHALLRESGGIYTNAEVTDRGVAVGKVGKLALTADGVSVELILDHGTKISRDTTATVANLSFVGEQYVDLQPRSASAPFLANGDVIPVEDTFVPISDTQFLTGIDRLVSSVDRAELASVVKGLGTAFAGAGQDLQTIIDRGNSVLATATRDLPVTLDLIRQGKAVLDTAAQTGGELRDFSKSLASLTGQLKASDPDLRRLFDNGILSAQQLDGLLKDNEKALSPLLANLVTLGEIQAARLPGLKEILLVYPENIRNGFLNAPGDGTSHFGIVTNTGAPVCTKGYEETKRRTGEQLGDVPANVKAYCNEPKDSATDVRGSRNVPRPAGDCTDPALLPGRAAAKGGQCISTPQTEQTGSTAASAANATANPRARVVAYDPLSRTATLPDGSTRWITRTNGQSDLMGVDGWKWLIFGPTATSF